MPNFRRRRDFAGRVTKVLCGRKMKTKAIPLIFAVMLCSTRLFPDKAQLGSPDFSPSASNPIGWRGDGSGQYPGATPPISWGQQFKQLAGLRCAAEIPKDNSKSGGEPAVLGFFTEWLAAGPIKITDPSAAITEPAPGESNLAPRAGDKLGDIAWQAIKTEDSFMEVTRVIGVMDKTQAAYAQACLYADKSMKIWLQVNHAQGLKLWLNGNIEYAKKDTPVNNGNGDMGPTLELNLKSGWNRFLFKLTPRLGEQSDFPKGCFVRCRFWPSEGPREYIPKNISWITRMPGLTQSNPIVAGNNIFTMAHPYNLVCADKRTGKILWIKQNSPYDAATAEERKAKPDVFEKMDLLSVKRTKFYDDFVSGKMPDEISVKAETTLEAELDKLMLEADEKYKKPDQQGEPDWWTIPTPASDGKGIFVFLERGISAGYGLDGKRLWIRYERPRHQHHGYFGSPVITDNKFVILDGTVTALDLLDGSVKWSVDLEPIKSWRIWFGSLSRCVIEGAEYVLCPGGNLLMRSRDGKIFGSQKSGNFDSTPVYADGFVWQPAADIIFKYPVKTAGDRIQVGSAFQAKAPAGVNLLGLNFYQGHMIESSLLIDKGLVYAVTGNGILMVFDAEQMNMVYRKELPLDLFTGLTRSSYCGASVTLAGQNIYVMGSSGVLIVFKPGRKYEEVSRNRIQYLANSGRALGEYRYFKYGKKYCPEYQDCTMTATPVFEGSSMYFRSEENLYCIEEK